MEAAEGLADLRELLPRVGGSFIHKLCLTLAWLVSGKHRETWDYIVVLAGALATT